MFELFDLRSENWRLGVLGIDRIELISLQSSISRAAVVAAALYNFFERFGSMFSLEGGDTIVLADGVIELFRLRGEEKSSRKVIK